MHKKANNQPYFDDCFFIIHQMEQTKFCGLTKDLNLRFFSNSNKELFIIFGYSNNISNII
jgi:hypothetical protein